MCTGAYDFVGAYVSITAGSGVSFFFFFAFWQIVPIVVTLWQVVFTGEWNCFLDPDQDH